MDYCDFFLRINTILMQRLYVRGVQQYMLKFVSDLKQVGGFLRILRFPPPIKLTALLKVALNTIRQANKQIEINSCQINKAISLLALHRCRQYGDCTN
jgi:hypothetical protein